VQTVSHRSDRAVRIGPFGRTGGRFRSHTGYDFLFSRHVEDLDVPSRWEVTTRELEGHVLAPCIDRGRPPPHGPAEPHQVAVEHADIAALLG
jgi:hypothetical protein